MKTLTKPNETEEKGPILNIDNNRITQDQFILSMFLN